MTEAHMARTLSDFMALPEGTELGVSNWIALSQEEIDAFGVLTRDHDPQHMNPEWARTRGPYGETVLFGFQTLAMLTWMIRDIGNTDLEAAAHGMTLNYGFDRVRFVAPVRMGAPMRGRFTLGPTRDDKGGRRIRTIRATVEVEGETRPALVADWLTAYLPPRESGSFLIDPQQE
jgi:acyl dehydratase